MFQRQLRGTRPTRTTHVPASIALLASDADRANAPLGGWHGETMAPRTPEPPTPAPEPFIIEPPPWRTDPVAAAALAPAAPPERRDALAEMKAADADADYDPPAPPGPPLALPPFIRPTPPEPDWRAEEVARAIRNAPDADELEPAASMSRYPARKQRGKS